MSLKVCRDEVVAIVAAANGRCSTRRPKHYATQFIGLEAFVAYKHKYKAPIVLVIESPHIEEFKVSGIHDLVSGEPVHSRPVNGASGRNIMARIGTLVSSTGMALGTGNYPVIVMNAIQEQCSEGKDTLVTRTRNFISLWNSRKAWLEERLRQVEPFIAINACTVGDFRMDNGLSAYASGNRAEFRRYFQALLENEFGLVQVGQPGSFDFMGSLDLSGLVMNAMHKVYSGTGTALRKTTHPASWYRREPVLRNYATQMFYYGQE
ncbi:MAG: hypothetical protein PVF46_03130 [Lysobacterales bacterium]|jgi:hypothetical protein